MAYLFYLILVLCYYTGDLIGKIGLLVVYVFFVVIFDLFIVSILLFYLVDLLNGIYVYFYYFILGYCRYELLYEFRLLLLFNVLFLLKPI